MSTLVFHFMAFMGNTMKFVYGFLCGRVFSFLLGTYAGVGLLGYMVNKSFEELPNCFPQQLQHCTFLQAICEGSSFSTFSQSYYLFDYSYARGCEVVSHQAEVAIPTKASLCTNHPNNCQMGDRSHPWSSNPSQAGPGQKKHQPVNKIMGSHEELLF